MKQSTKVISASQNILFLSRDKWDKRSQANMAAWTTEFKQRFQPGEVDFRKSQADLFNAQALIYITLPKTYPFGQSMISVLLPKH